MGWNVAIVAVVVVGIVAVVLARGSGEGSANTAPFYATADQPQSHWHTAVGVNVCGEWLTDIPTFEFQDGSPAAIAGIHTHSDGLIHTHPNNSDESGENATLGKFAEYAGWSASAQSLDTWTGPASAPDRTEWRNGDTCGFGEFEGQPGRVVWAVDGKAEQGNPADHRLRDGETMAIGFLPKGAELGFPPGACNAFANISDLDTAASVSKGSPCLESTTTTTPGAATTTTTAPPG
jgi:hypothetical protein